MTCLFDVCLSLCKSFFFVCARHRQVARGERGWNEEVRVCVATGDGSIAEEIGNVKPSRHIHTKYSDLRVFVCIFLFGRIRCKRSEAWAGSESNQIKAMSG